MKNERYLSARISAEHTVRFSINGVEDWYLGKRGMPDYLLRLMTYKIEMEGFRRENGEE